MRWRGGEGLAISKAFFGEGAAGVGFEVFLEFQCPILIMEGTIPNQFPWLEFCGVRRLACVVLGNPSLKIRGCADVFLFGKISAADDVDVPHRLYSPSSPFGLCRAPFA